MNFNYFFHKIKWYGKISFVVRFFRYVNNVALSSKPEAEPVVGAIFGLGRAGSIHLSNIINNPRIVLKYIVDDRQERFNDLKKHWKLNDVTFLTSRHKDIVYGDKS